MSLEIVVEEFVDKFHQNKDPMHDITHIRRLRLQAGKLCRALGVPKNSIAKAIYYHGLTEEQAKKLDHFMLSYGHDEQDIDNLRRLASMMKHDSLPTTIEEKIIHDCHVLEGGKYFYTIKSLITGSHRGQSLQESLDRLEQKIIPKTKCYLPMTRELLEEQLEQAEKIIADLRNNLPI